MVIALTGEKLAGKSTVAAYFHERYHARVLRFSQTLSNILTQLHQPNTRENLVRLGSNLRQIFGDDILAKVVKEDILTSPHDWWVVDGLRYVSEHEIMSDVVDYYLLNITAPLEMRWQRARQRSEKTDEAKMSLAEFTKREQDATERQITPVQAKATHTVNNLGSFQDLYNSIDQWLASVRHIG